MTPSVRPVGEVKASARLVLRGRTESCSVAGMLTLRLTQRLARRIRVDLPAQVHPAGDACADWCCHAFSFARRRYVLVTHATTFFSVVMLAKGAGNAPGLVKVVTAGLRTYLAQGEHAFVLEQRIAPEMAEVVFSPIKDRRVLGVMNEFIQMASLYLVDLSPVETSDRLNGCPVGPLGGRVPSEAFPPGRVAPDIKPAQTP